jgi:hypothetical protein
MYFIDKNSFFYFDGPFWTLLVVYRTLELEQHAACSGSGSDTIN